VASGQSVVNARRVATPSRISAEGIPRQGFKVLRQRIRHMVEPIREHAENVVSGIYPLGNNPDKLDCPYDGIFSKSYRLGFEKVCSTCGCRGACQEHTHKMEGDF
jgi:hypothetical protein